MFWSFCSAKGGVGTSVIAGSIARELAKGGSVLVVDLAGDQPDLLGVGGSDRPGLRDWLVAEDEVDHEALLGLTEHVDDGLYLLRSGGVHDVGAVSASRVVEVVTISSDAFDHVVADLGVVGRASFGPTRIMLASSDRTSLVVRACYLALRRSGELGLDVDDVIEVVEGGRALQTVDVEAVFRQPVGARVPLDPTIARAADAGLLATRVPRTLRRALRALVASVESVPA